MDIRSDQISRSVVSNSLRPHESQHTRPPCPTPTPGVHSDSCPSSQWCHPAISSSVLLPPIPPSIRVLSNESTLCMRWLVAAILERLALPVPDPLNFCQPYSFFPDCSLFSEIPSPVFWILPTFQCHLQCQSKLSTWARGVGSFIFSTVDYLNVCTNIISLYCLVESLETYFCFSPQA